MDCIDCHSSQTIHGDGNIYSKAEEQVAVRCETCHGNLDHYASLTDQKGQRLYHTSKRGREYYLETKVSKAKKRIPQVAQLKEVDALPAAMEIPAHLQDIKDRHRLECYACHAQTVTQCYGCHLKRDDRKHAVTDWVSGTKAKSRTLSGTWEGKADYIRWSEAVIGLNSRGHVSPFVPGGQIAFTRISRDGKPIALNQISPAPREEGNPDDVPFFSFNPVQPHSVTKQARSCESCHNSPKALGLGHEGFGVISTVTGGTGVAALPFERWVDEQGKMIQSTAHAGSRAFAKEELDRINRLNVCQACHKSTASPQAWKSVLDYFGRATTNKQHKQFIQRIFREGNAPR
jgi:hypothetical protein